MKIAKRFRSIRIFPKLFLTFLLVLSPIYFISFKMNQSGSENVKEEIANSLSSRVNLYMKILDDDFDRTIRLLQENVVDDDLMKLSTLSEAMTDLEKTQAILRLKNRLDLLKSSSKYLENTMAFIPALDRTVSANVNAITEFDPEEFAALSQVTDRFASPFLIWHDRIFISIAYPFATPKKLFLLAVEVFQPQLASALSQFTNEGGGTVLTGRKALWAVTGADNKDQGEEFLQQAKKDVHLDGKLTSTIKIGAKTYMLAKKDSERLDTTMMMFVPMENVSQALETYKTWLLALSVAVVIIVLAFSYGIYRMIHQPLKSLIFAFRKLQQGDFNLNLQYPFTDEFGYLYEQFNSTVKQLDVLVHEVYEQQFRVRLAELRHLQSQINPHFLYNTYFLLYRMAKLNDNENIVHLTKHLGEYFQYITRDGLDEVPYEKEAAHGKTYMEIQTIRFSNRIEASFKDIPEGTTSILVPRLILQPIIENAYNHALEKKAKAGWLQVETSLSAEELIITVEDNGDEMTEEKLLALQLMLLDTSQVIESTALINVHRRLQIKHGSSAGLRLSMGKHNGLKVGIVIPIKEVKL